VEHKRKRGSGLPLGVFCVVLITVYRDLVMVFCDLVMVFCDLVIGMVLFVCLFVCSLFITACYPDFTPIINVSS